jgi:hypothetical protein
MLHRLVKKRPADSERFEALLAITRGEPTKAVYLKAVGEIVTTYKTDILHQIEIGSFTTVSGLSIAPYIEGLPVDEGDYLDEAQRCLSVEALRGCIVLGWCATKLVFLFSTRQPKRCPQRQSVGSSLITRNSQLIQCLNCNASSTLSCCGF